MGTVCVLFPCKPGETAAEEIQALSTAEEKPKEGVKTDNNNCNNLRVVEQEGPVVQFKIKRRTPLNKLMTAYCEWQDTMDVFQQQTEGVC
uniref:Rad60/SUMO-like domain-containing protein n=1 Tax=Equus asinus TaxID=9793 RepID=A0A8C4KXQ8_EQUAS